MPRGAEEERNNPQGGPRLCLAQKMSSRTSRVSTQRLALVLGGRDGRSAVSASVSPSLALQMQLDLAQAGFQ